MADLTPLRVAPQLADAGEAAALAAPQRVLGAPRSEYLLAIKRWLGRSLRQKIDALEQGAQFRARATLQSERSLDAAPLGEIEQRATRGCSFVGHRSTLTACHPSESQAASPVPGALHKRAAVLEALARCASLEAEMAELPPQDRSAFLAGCGARGRAGAVLTRAVAERARIIASFSTGEDGCRAGSIARGTLARGAAVRIRSDLERGLIRAELMSWADFGPLRGNRAEARRLGKMRLESRDCEVQDGNIVHFRFNV